MIFSLCPKHHLTAENWEINPVLSNLCPEHLIVVQTVVMNVQVSLIDLKGPTLLYQKHIASEISTGIISLQFETCSLQGFEKNVLVVATKDSSVLAVDVNTGNMLSTSTVHPNKPSKALFMQILGRH